MTREEKILLAIEKGITCNPETGEVFGIRGKVMKKKHTNGYLVLSVTNNKKTYEILQHQFIYYWVHKKVVECIDHINGVKYDNRIENIREVTKQENAFNTKAKGYYYNKKRNIWQVYIQNINRKYIGAFNTKEEAHQAYLEAKKKYHQIVIL